MGELYLDDIDRNLWEKYKRGLDVCRTEESEKTAGNNYPGDAFPSQESPFEPLPDECTYAG
ncbi:MAG TPA: hypothetical protein VMB24_04370 [Dehalococcoidales bacterium]|nr:hypothetical protein [Dehalococcoidales bacterium]